LRICSKAQVEAAQEALSLKRLDTVVFVSKPKNLHGTDVQRAWLTTNKRTWPNWRKRPTKN